MKNLVFHYPKTTAQHIAFDLIVKKIRDSDLEVHIGQPTDFSPLKSVILRTGSDARGAFLSTDRQPVHFFTGCKRVSIFDVMEMICHTDS